MSFLAGVQTPIGPGAAVRQARALLATAQHAAVAMQMQHGYQDACHGCHGCQHAGAKDARPGLQCVVFILRIREPGASIELSH